MAETEPRAAITAAENTGQRTTYNDVIGGSDVLAPLADEEQEDGIKDVEAVVAMHPGLAPIQGGDVSDAPAAQSGTHGEGTGADTGTGAEVGITRPG